MAVGTHPTPIATNDTSTIPSTKPLELSLTLPSLPGLRIHLHLTLLSTSLILFVTTTHLDSGTQNGSAMGSLVYAMPDRYNSAQPLSTALYTLPASQDFATRLAKVLARRTARGCYVGCSVDLAGGASGGSVEEEMEGFRGVVGVVVAEVERREGEA